MAEEQAPKAEQDKQDKQNQQKPERVEDLVQDLKNLFGNGNMPKPQI